MKEAMYATNARQINPPTSSATRGATFTRRRVSLAPGGSADPSRGEGTTTPRNTTRERGA